MSLLELWLPVAAAWFVLWLFSEDKTPLGEVRLGTLGIWIVFTVIVVITLSFVCGLVLLLGKTFLSNYPRDDSSIFSACTSGYWFLWFSLCFSVKERWNRGRGLEAGSASSPFLRESRIAARFHLIRTRFGIRLKGDAPPQFSPRMVSVRFPEALPKHCR
jgi:hypothetical protein